MRRELDALNNSLLSTLASPRSNGLSGTMNYSSRLSPAVAPVYDDFGFELPNTPRDESNPSPPPARSASASREHRFPSAQRAGSRPRLSRLWPSSTPEKQLLTPKRLDHGSAAKVPTPSEQHSGRRSDATPRSPTLDFLEAALKRLEDHEKKLQAQSEALERHQRTQNEMFQKLLSLQASQNSSVATSEQTSPHSRAKSLLDVSQASDRSISPRNVRSLNTRDESRGEDSLPLEEPFTSSQTENSGNPQTNREATEVMGGGIVKRGAGKGDMEVTKTSSKPVVAHDLDDVSVGSDGSSDDDDVWDQAGLEGSEEEEVPVVAAHEARERESRDEANFDSGSGEQKRHSDHKSSSDTEHGMGESTRRTSPPSNDASSKTSQDHASAEPSRPGTTARDEEDERESSEERYALTPSPPTVESLSPAEDEVESKPWPHRASLDSHHSRASSISKDKSEEVTLRERSEGSHASLEERSVTDSVADGSRGSPAAASAEPTDIEKSSRHVAEREAVEHVEIDDDSDEGKEGGRDQSAVDSNEGSDIASFVEDDDDLPWDDSEGSEEPPALDVSPTTSSSPSSPAAMESAAGVDEGSTELHSAKPRLEGQRLTRPLPPAEPQPKLSISSPSSDKSAESLDLPGDSSNKSNSSKPPPPSSSPPTAKPSPPSSPYGPGFGAMSLDLPGDSSNKSNSSRPSPPTAKLSPPSSPYGPGFGAMSLDLPGDSSNKSNSSKPSPPSSSPPTAKPSPPSSPYGPGFGAMSLDLPGDSSNKSNSSKPSPPSSSPPTAKPSPPSSPYGPGFGAMSLDLPGDSSNKSNSSKPSPPSSSPPTAKPSPPSSPYGPGFGAMSLDLPGDSSNKSNSSKPSPPSSSPPTAKLSPPSSPYGPGFGAMSLDLPGDSSNKSNSSKPSPPTAKLSPPSSPYGPGFGAMSLDLPGDSSNKSNSSKPSPPSSSPPTAKPSPPSSPYGPGFGAMSLDLPGDSSNKSNSSKPSPPSSSPPTAKPSPPSSPYGPGFGAMSLDVGPPPPSPIDSRKDKRFSIVREDTAAAGSAPAGSAASPPPRTQNAGQASPVSQTFSQPTVELQEFVHELVSVRC